ncbi:MAG: hypothetical protein VYA80_01465 [Pseudomonadota bacterium]|nr:hypothetical protein [Pseudomonadota bacterium]
MLQNKLFNPSYSLIALMGLFLSLSCPLATAKSPLPIDNQEFTDEDFDKFFGLLVDGKVTQEKNEKRCADEKIGFTFTGKELSHNSKPTRINYNVTKLDMTVDGRPFRSKYRNATFGEWTGQVFKPLCGGLYNFTIDYSLELPEQIDPRDINVQIYLQRNGDSRPGLMVMESHPNGNQGYATGQANVVLPMSTGDEVSTWTSLDGGIKTIEFESVAISGYKISHLPELTLAFDQSLWTEDMKALDSRLGALMP